MLVDQYLRSLAPGLAWYRGPEGIGEWVFPGGTIPWVGLAKHGTSAPDGLCPAARRPSPTCTAFRWEGPSRPGPGARPGITDPQRKGPTGGWVTRGRWGCQATGPVGLPLLALRDIGPRTVNGEPVRTGVIRRPYYKDGWILFTQRDHAVLSGALMARWGNDMFASLTAHAEVLFGIAEHDNGWDEWEQAPEIHVESGYPLHFTELTSEAYGAIWRRGVERHRTRHPYAALLIALHTENLARRRLNRVLAQEDDRVGSPFQGEISAGGELASLKTFIADMEKLRGELTDAVIAQAKVRADGLEADIKANFRLLQIGDLLSLEFCCGLSGPFTVEQVPTQATGRFLSATFEPVSEDTLAVSPYPFSEPDVAVAAPGRIVCQKAFASSEDFRDHLKEADSISLTFCLKPQ